MKFLAMHITKIYIFDPYNVFLAIATNIPQRLKTGFVVQDHKLSLIVISIVLYIHYRLNVCVVRFSNVLKEIFLLTKAKNSNISKYHYNVKESFFYVI